MCDVEEAVEPTTPRNIEGPRLLYSDVEPEKRPLHPPITLTPTSNGGNETPPSGSSSSPASQGFLRAYPLDLRRCSTPAGNPRPSCMLECRYCRFLSEGFIAPSSGSSKSLFSPSPKGPSSPSQTSKEKSSFLP